MIFLAIGMIAIGIYGLYLLYRLTQLRGELESILRERERLVLELEALRTVCAVKRQDVNELSRQATMLKNYIDRKKGIAHDE